MKLRGLLSAVFAAALSLVATATLANVVMQAPGPYRAPSEPPPGGDEITTFQLTSTPGGSALGFMVGQAFVEGDVPDGVDVVSDTSGVVLRSVCEVTWPDDSCKHAVLVGTFNGTAATPLTVTLKTGTAGGGTPLTCPDIATAAPSASVQAGAIGTVNLSSLLASPFRTYISTPEMVECHYRSAIGADTHLAAWFHVRMWTGGRTFIRAYVENGFLNGSPTNRTYTATVIIDGSTVFNSSVTQYPFTRWDVTGWIGGDPQVYLTHNADYLISTKLVPNFASYAKGGASSTVLNGFDTSHAPMSPGPWPNALGAGGASDWIGPVPQHDALCIIGVDPRACNGADVATRSMGVFSLHRRSSATNVNPRPADFATSGYNSNPVNGCGGLHGDVSNDVYTWDVAHAPLQGYVSYLRSGDWYYLEELSFQAQTYYFCRGSSNGSGVNRTMRGYQNRAVGWGFNIVGSWLAIAPSDGPLAADANVVSGFATWFGNVVTNFASTVNSNGIGLPYMFSTGAWDVAVGNGSDGSIAPWMTEFWDYSVGHCLDIKCLANLTDLSTLAADLFKFPVGLLGPTGAGNYYYAYAGQYGLYVDATASGVDFNPDVTDFLDSFSDVFLGTNGFANSGLTTNTLQGSGGANPALADGYWNNLAIAIVPAVNHGAPGASTSYARLIGATNWPPAGSGSNNCNNKPNYCVEPW